MRAIYYNTQDRWGDYWKEVKEDSCELDTRSYPIFPAIHYLKKDGRILEAGCGLGRIVKWLFKRNYKVVAMELEEYSIRKLKSDLPQTHCVRGDAGCLPFKNISFLYIFLMGVLDIFTNDALRANMLKESARILKNKGTAFISVPHQQSLFWLMYRLKRNPVIRKICGKEALPQHFGQFAFNKNELSALIGNHFPQHKIFYANTRMAFFYLCPHLRAKSVRTMDFPALQKLERNRGENIYVLSPLGEFLYSSSRLFKHVIGPTLYAVAFKSSGE